MSHLGPTLKQQAIDGNNLDFFTLLLVNNLKVEMRSIQYLQLFFSIQMMLQVPER